MIPADHITFTDDGHAWWVCRGDVQKADGVDEVLHELDRPCDTWRPICNRIGPNFGKPDHHGCPDCHGTGRHTFDIEVSPVDPPTCQRHDPCDCTCYSGRPHCRMGCGYEQGSAWSQRHHRVSVVPGMVLPILGEDPEVYVDRWIEVHPNGWCALYDWDEDAQEHTITPVTLPSAAKPGGCAVKLRVAS